MEENCPVRMCKKSSVMRRRMNSHGRNVMRGNAGY